MKKITLAFALTVLLVQPLSAFAAKKKYTCTTDNVKLSFSVKEGTSTDKVSGSAYFQSKKFTGEINGVYEAVSDTFIATVKAPGNKNKALTGTYNSELDQYLLKARIAKGLALDFVCNNKKKSEDSLTGEWTVNDQSFFSVSITEDAKGAIAGKILKGFDGYTLEGTHLSESIYIYLSSPDGTDDAIYQLHVCGSKLSLAGTVQTVGFNTLTETVWCKKGLASKQECPPDPTC